MASPQDEQAGGTTNLRARHTQVRRHHINLCKQCHQQPANPGYDFCSVECGRICELPGCTTPKFSGKGVTSRFCSHEHRKEAVVRGIETPCTVCREFPQEPGLSYCGAMCAKKAKSPGPGAPRPQMTLGPGSNSRIVPRPPQPNMKPHSAFMVEFGEYNGQPNYLIRSKKGLGWTNLPQDLHDLCQEKEQFSSDILDFALGPSGKFYIAYRDGSGVGVKTSPGLWESINEDFRQGGLRELEFGPDGVVWGVKAWRDYGQSQQHTPPGSGLHRVNTVPAKPYTVVEEPFGAVPNSLTEKATELARGRTHHSQVDFVAVGFQGSWVMGVGGQFLYWDRIAANVIKQLTSAWQSAGAVRNVELCPCRPDIYFIEPVEGKVAYRVPDEWFSHVRDHFQDHNRLSFESAPPTPGHLSRPTTGGLGHGHGPGRHGPSPHHGRGSPSSVNTNGSGSGSSPGVGGHNGGFDPGFGRPSGPSYPPPPGPPQYYPPPPGPPAPGPPMYQYQGPPPQISQYADQTATSGMMQAKKGDDSGGTSKMEILKEVISVTPKILDAGVQLAQIDQNGGCTIM